MKIIGRKKEKKILLDVLNSNKQELCVIYGRRRCGKTFLVDNLYQEKMNEKECLLIKLVGSKAFIQKKYNFINIHNQLNNFLRDLLVTEISLKEEIKGLLVENHFENWFEVFSFIAQINRVLKNTYKKTVLFIDEIAWIHSKRSDFIEAFSVFINSTALSEKMKVIISGSTASWIKKNILNNTGSLYNRRSKLINLKPFTLDEVKEFLQYKGYFFNQYEIIRFYMLLGGVPFYYENIDLNLSFDKILKQHLMTGEYENEFDLLFTSLFNPDEHHREIVELLGRKNFAGYNINYIIEQLEPKENITDGSFYNKINKNLEELIECGFISSNNQLFNKTKEKQYYLTDSFCYFYLNFIKEKTIHYSEQELKIFLGNAFEIFCFNQIELIKQELHITDSVEVFALNKENFQIDLILYYDKMLTVCECKFYESAEYEIDEKESKLIYNRIESLQQHLNQNRISKNKVRKINLCLLTLNGVKNKKDNRISLDNIMQYKEVRFGDL